MAGSPDDTLEAFVERIENDEEIESEMLEDLTNSMEENMKYEVADYHMICTGEDVLVAFDSEDQSFVQVNVPRGEDGEARISTLP